MNLMHLLFDAAIILILIIGIRQFRAPRGARIGNLTAAFAILCAFLLVLLRHDILSPMVVLAALLIGSAFGWVVAVRVNMTQIPAMVAFQHGAGGIAAFLVAFVELTGTGAALAAVNRVSGLLGLVIGSATFSGSMVASGKLAGKLRQTPTRLPAHGWLLSLNLLIIGAICVFAWTSFGSFNSIYLVIVIFLSALLGVLFSIRIGGADMPVLISFLNATAGLAAAFCGIIIQNRLLIACGATVAASGSILTHVMCRAMNRNLFKVFVGIQQKISARPAGGEALQTDPPEQPQGEAADEETSLGTEKPDDFSQAVSAIKAAGRIIIIPGYGMALAQAQFAVCELANKLEDMGKQVKFAIHPVAGRMPGHMNVLLAEADVDYDKLFEMDEINPEFKDTDLALIVGACDVVNPAAISVEDTPISGMPILMAHEAGKVIVCNLDEKPGYSGVENPLYDEDGTILLFGDAKGTVTELIKRTVATDSPQDDAADDGPSPEGEKTDSVSQVVSAMKAAGKIIIIPGYGMALAQAQFAVCELANKLEDMGKQVKFAIHPVAGRMPGHMNVLLAEADVDYDKLFEMDEINPEFKDTDLALIVGACDVVNPTAISVEDTPISGMPILMAHEAGKVVVCNLDEKPGYSGVENPLYKDDGTILLFGDAKGTITELVKGLE